MKYYTWILSFLCAAVCFVAAACEPESPNHDGGDSTGNIDAGETGSVDADWLPKIENIPDYYWEVTDLLYDSDRNSLDPGNPDSGLRNHLLCQSMMGLAHKALKDGSYNVGIWMCDDNEFGGTIQSHRALDALGAKSLGKKTAKELFYETGEHSVRPLIKGYILVDVENNPESDIVATVAAHVYNSIIVDVKDEQEFKNAGLTMTYDATDKSTIDSWKEFRDKCDNRALVLMPVQIAELREFAIANGLFCVNLNHVYNDTSHGDNFDLFKEIMMWLEPNSPVYGWDHGIEEYKIADAISIYGNHSVPYDWAKNTSLTSVCYPERQNFKAKNIDPRAIDYDSEKQFVSFYMSDGDNVQWIMADFESMWYDHPMNGITKMSFGLPVINTSMIGPAQLQNLFNKQNPEASVFERSSYFFLDDYGVMKDRQAILKDMARKQAVYMKKHDVRILGMATRYDTDGPSAIEGYQAMIDANDELEAIITIAYSPYADSDCETIWLKNSKGYDIPVIRTTYCIWSFEDHNDPDEGSPAYIYHQLQQEKNKFNLICIHCWSKWWDRGKTDDELAEIIPYPANYPYQDPTVIYAAGGAELCQRRFEESDNISVVSLQELVWRIRMEHNPEQTWKALSEM